MEHVKRLVLMPEHMAENATQSKPLVPPLTSQVNHLDSEMDSLLKRQDITQDEKARLRRGSRPWRKWLEPRSNFFHLGIFCINLLEDIAILSHSQPRCSVANQSQCEL